MEHDAPPGILGIELFAHSRRKDNGKFQPLALVDAHDPDRVRLLIQDPGLSVVHIIFLQLLDITDEIKQPFVAGSLKGGRPLHKHLHICSSLSPSRHG